jgi:hypothetical protein
MILTSDWHLDDNPANDYRWLVFDALKAQRAQGEHTFYMLGDLCDKKDRHSAALVNRLVDAFVDFFSRGRGERMVILRGNHDDALKGKPFWNILNALELPITFIDEITLMGNRLFLPYSPDPATEWADIPYKGIKAVFIHQTLTGAKAEGAMHREMEGKPGIPLFPPGLKIYSGDIHLPQLVNWGSDVVYVGAPHLVRFGDEHETRLLRIDEAAYDITEIIQLRTIHKTILSVSSMGDPAWETPQPGDAVKVRFSLASDQIEQWPIIENQIKEWAVDKQVVLSSIEPIIEQVASTRDVPVADGFDQDPYALLYAFAEAEGLDPGLVLAAETLLESGKL